MKYLKYYLLAALIFAADQFVKRIIKLNWELGEAHPVIGDFFQIVSHRNKGAAFGILQNQRWFFIAVTTIVLIGLIWYLQKCVKERKTLLPFALGLILGGALGNFYDRLLYGEVVDFLQFYFAWFDYTFPIFNIADSAIVIGVILIFLDTLLEWNNERRGQVQNVTE